jgi:hypothetical protein
VENLRKIVVVDIKLLKQKIVLQISCCSLHIATECDTRLRFWGRKRG